MIGAPNREPVVIGGSRGGAPTHSPEEVPQPVAGFEATRVLTQTPKEVAAEWQAKRQKYLAPIRHALQGEKNPAAPPPQDVRRTEEFNVEADRALRELLEQMAASMSDRATQPSVSRRIIDAPDEPPFTPAPDLSPKEVKPTFQEHRSLAGKSARAFRAKLHQTLTATAVTVEPPKEPEENLGKFLEQMMQEPVEPATIPHVAALTMPNLAADTEINFSQTQPDKWLGVGPKINEYIKLFLENPSKRNLSPLIAIYETYIQKHSEASEVPLIYPVKIAYMGLALAERLLKLQEAGADTPLIKMWSETLSANVIMLLESFIASEDPKRFFDSLRKLWLRYVSRPVLNTEKTGPRYLVPEAGDPQMNSDYGSYCLEVRMEKKFQVSSLVFAQLRNMIVVRRFENQKTVPTPLPDRFLDGHSHSALSNRDDGKYWVSIVKGGVIKKIPFTLQELGITDQYSFAGTEEAAYQNFQQVFEQRVNEMDGWKPILTLRFDEKRKILAYSGKMSYDITEAGKSNQDKLDNADLRVVLATDEHLTETQFLQTNPLHYNNLGTPVSFQLTVNDRGEVGPRIGAKYCHQLQDGAFALYENHESLKQAAQLSEQHPQAETYLKVEQAQHFESDQSCEVSQALIDKSLYKSRVDTLNEKIKARGIKFKINWQVLLSMATMLTTGSESFQFLEAVPVEKSLQPSLLLLPEKLQTLINEGSEWSVVNEEWLKALIQFWNAQRPLTQDGLGIAAIMGTLTKNPVISFALKSASGVLDKEKTSLLTKSVLGSMLVTRDGYQTEAQKTTPELGLKTLSFTTAFAEIYPNYVMGAIDQDERYVVATIRDRTEKREVARSFKQSFPANFEKIVTTLEKFFS